jgi:hypothetical protein
MLLYFSTSWSYSSKRHLKQFDGLFTVYIYCTSRCLVGTLNHILFKVKGSVADPDPNPSVRGMDPDPDPDPDLDPSITKQKK